jgi:ring-1,2-phenylacetyl-CoA epoxidase subunit PaaE
MTSAEPAVLSDSASEEEVAGFHRLRVVDVEPLTADSVAITLAVPEELAERFRARPGQHLTLRRSFDGVEVRRTYSLCGRPDSPLLRVGVKRIEDGLFSGWATQDLKPGDELEVAVPAGRFGLDIDPTASRHVVAVAAGSGITPVLSILQAVLHGERASRVTLVYGNRTTRDVMFLEDLYDLKDRFPDRFVLLNVLSREEQESELLSGRIDRDRLLRLTQTLVPSDDVDAWFLCGPFEMVTTARDVLVGELGVPASRVHMELFHAEPVARRPRPATAPAGASRVKVVLSGRTTEVDVDGDTETVLDAVLRVRADAPYACKGGVCGTCRARLVSGEVEMDVNYALEPDELEAGVVLTCQSRPTTPEVALEFLS